MPNFILNRDKVVASSSGRTIAFVKDKPTHVPDQMINEVLAVGAVPEDSSILKEPAAPTVPQGVEREGLILKAMKAMMSANIREDFTAGGKPSTQKLSTRVGFSVDPRERDALWERLTVSKD